MKWKRRPLLSRIPCFAEPKRAKSNDLNPFFDWRVFLLPLLRWHVVHEAEDARSVVAAAGHVQGFVKLPAVFGELEGAAHFVASRILLLRNASVAIPLRGDFLVAVIFRLFQFTPIGYERPFAIMIVH